MVESAGIFARESHYLGRYVQVGIAGNRVISVSFPPEPSDEAGSAHRILDRIARYLDGVKEDFSDVELAMTVSDGHREVLNAVRSVPYGRQIDVETLMRMTPSLDPEDADDHTLTQEALAGNPVPLIIQDHRIRDGASGAPAEVEQRLRSIEGL